MEKKEVCKTRQTFENQKLESIAEGVSSSNSRDKVKMK